MVSATTIKVRSLVLIFCLLFAHISMADSDRSRHWSEGVYFPPQTLPQQRARGSYAPGVQAQPQPGHSGAGRPKYNPWALQRGDNDSQRPPSYESMGYPSQDYDPYRNAARGRRQRPAEEEPYPPHPGDFAAAEYYSGQSRYESEPPPLRSNYPPGDYGGRLYDARPFSPAYGLENYFPFYDTTNSPWTGLNPFFMYGVGTPYLPYWW